MSRISINTNLSSLNAQRRLSEHTNQLDDIFSRLSSGIRINKASDDAAGLAISESLKSETRIVNQGIRNINDGISLLSIADSALQELGNLTSRLAELAEQSSNGTLGQSQRLSIDKEAQELAKEFNRIARTTSFNNINIFDAGFDKLSISTGSGLTGFIEGDLGGGINDGTFQTGGSFSSLASIWDIVSADVNGDGNKDIISISSANGNISVHLGNGDGTFQDGVTYNTSQPNAYSMKVADLNNNGILDIVTGGSFGANILFGNGDGTFQAPTLLTSNVTIARSIEITDLNNNGIKDIVVVDQNAGNGRVLTFLGNGDGTFETGTTYITGGTTVSTQKADFDNDGNMDILVGTFGNPEMFVLFGDGEGGFDSQTNLEPVGGTRGSIVVGDFNNDGVMDIIERSSFNRIVYFAGNEDRTFQDKIDTAIEPEASTIISADFNADGNLDLVLGMGNTGNIKTYFGNGDGTFASGEVYTSGATPSGFLIVDDFNNNNIKDIGMAQSNVGNAFSIFTGNGGSGVAPLDQFTLRNIHDARSSLDYFKQEIDKISSQRAKVGSLDSRLQSALSNQKQVSLSLSEANNRIEDADIAEESARLVATRIRQQAATSLLAQANQQPEIALRLLDL